MLRNFFAWLIILGGCGQGGDLVDLDAPVTDAAAIDAPVVDAATADVSTDTDAAWADAGPCSLDPPTLSALTHNYALAPIVEAQPGDRVDFDLGWIGCCYFFMPVAACATWSVSPTTGATIDPDTGMLRIRPTAAPGSVYTVTADVENGRKLVTAEVYVYTPEQSPLRGSWHEVAQIDCTTGGEVPVAVPFQEMRFWLNGTFDLTWMPFELYVDYWGVYTFDPALAPIELVVRDGNRIPSDFDGTGTASLDAAGRLFLHDVWLGTLLGGPRRCGHVLERW